MTLPSPQWAYYYSSRADSDYYLEGDFDDLSSVETSTVIEEKLAVENSFSPEASSADRDANLRELARNCFKASVSELMEAAHT
jgi:hypothetical protein